MKDIYDMLGLSFKNNYSIDTKQIIICVIKYTPKSIDKNKLETPLYINKSK